MRKKSSTFAQSLCDFLVRLTTMDFKNFWKETKTGFVLTNVLIAIGVIIIGVVVLQMCLKRYTEHGVEVEVPDITGLYMEEAKITLAADDLRLEVVDSTYSTKKPLGTIVEQNPVAGSKAKHGRVVYAVQNARFRRPVVMPEMRDVSLRQAKATLNSLGLTAADILYEPSTYRDIVLDIQTVNGDAILAGQTVAEGSAVVLVVGKGQGTAEVTVPSLSGKSLNEARSWLLSSMLTLGIVEYDEPPTEDNQDLYIVYSQMPQSGTVVVEGTSVNVKMSKDIEKTITTDNEGDEEEFF